MKSVTKTKELVKKILNNNSGDYRKLAMANEEFVANVLPDLYQPIELIGKSTRGRRGVGWDLEDYQDCQWDLVSSSTNIFVTDKVVKETVNVKFVECKQITPTPGSLQANHCDRWNADAFAFTFVDHPNQKIKVYYTKTNPSATEHFVKQDNVRFNNELTINEKSTKQNINTQVLLDCGVTIVDAEGRVTTESLASTTS